jgi:excisionase family DNA binding protein
MEKTIETTLDFGIDDCGFYDPMLFENQIMDIEDASKYLKVSTKTIYRLIKEGDIPYKRIGRSYRFHQMTLEEWVKKGF